MCIRDRYCTHSMALRALMPVVTEAVRISTCLSRIMGCRLSRNSSWLVASYSGVTT